MKSARDLTRFSPENCVLAIDLAFSRLLPFSQKGLPFKAQVLPNILFLVDILKAILLLLKSGFLAFCFYSKSHSVG